MDIINKPKLLTQYKPNSDIVNELALNTVARIETPIFNKLCSMSKQSILSILIIFPEKFKTLKTTEKSLMITLITDAITCMIKYKEFYDSLQGNNTYILDVLYRKIKNIFMQVKKDEVQIVKSHLNQMIKYAARIPYYPDLKHRLSEIQNNLTNYKANNENILIENYTTNVFKRKYSKAETENINRKKIAKKQENIIIKNDINLPKIQPKTCDQRDLEPKTISDKKVIIVKLPIDKKNAFTILMSSSKPTKQ